MPAYHLFQHFATTVFPSLVISWSRIIKRFEERRREKYSIREIAHERAGYFILERLKSSDKPAFL